MSNGRRRRRALCIVAAAAGLAWAVPRENSEDVEVVTLGVIFPPFDARAWPPSVGGDGKTGPRRALSLDPAEETLIRLKEEFRQSSGTTLNTAAAGSAVITGTYQECVESRISEGAQAADEQQVQKDAKLAEELKKRASVSPSRTQPPTYSDESMEYKTAFVEPAAEMIEPGAMMLGAVPVLTSDPSLETEREWGSTGGEISAEKYPEVPETDDSLPAAGHFCATNDGRSLDDEAFTRVVEKGPRPIKVGMNVEIATIKIATANKNSSPEDAENKDAVSDIYGAATCSAEGSLLVNTEKALEDGAVVCDSCDGGVVDSESTTTNVAQGLQQSGAEDAAITENPMGEAPEKSPSTYDWDQSSLEDGVTVGNHKENKEDSILLGNVAAPIATSVEASALEEPQRQRMSNDRVPAENARNDETLPPVATDTEAPRTSSRQGANVGEDTPNEEKGGEGAARKPAVFRYPLRTETSRSGAVGSGVALPLPGTQLNNNVVGPIPPSVAPPVNIRADALREHNGVQEGPSHGTSVERKGWWRKCVNVTKESTLRWVGVVGGKGRAVTEKVLAVIKVWLAKTWHESVELRAERFRRRLEDVGRSLFDEVGRYLADARLAEAL